jgi:methionine sulfoxide reductase heme-binding subunit
MEQALWFASRATGLVALLLLTGTVVLGCSHAGRAGGGRQWPRFTLHAVHRNLSLLTVLFVAVHASTAIIDPYAGLRWIDAVVPFVSSYHPLWLGLGAIAGDLLVATILTSLVRTRLPHRTWRVLHLATYALWPVAVVHAWGIGGEDRNLLWVIGLEIACGAAVAAALARRLLTRHPDAEARRAADRETWQVGT